MTDKNIDNYYSSVDSNYLEDLCKDSNLKNLIKLSVSSDIDIFNKKKTKLKSKKRILKDCENKKNESMCMISNLAKINMNNNIDKIIKCINNLDNEKYIEYYSND